MINMLIYTCIYVDVVSFYFSRTKRKQNFDTEQVSKHQKLLTETSFDVGEANQIVAFPCPAGHCSKVFSTRMALGRHVKLAKIECPECRIVFKTAEECQVHRKDKHWHKCDVCGQKYERAEELEKHSVTHKKDIKPTSIIITGQANSPPLNATTSQEAAPAGPPKWLCNTCGKFFNTNHALSQHKRTHMVFQCDLCSRVFTTARKLSAHTRLHPPPPV
jgi:KRAB domain-containing zinc finger protein